MWITTVLGPDISGPQTDDPVYNRRMVEEISARDVRAGRRPGDVGVADSPLDFSSREADVTGVGSLLARRPDAVRAVQNAPPTATAILLVHSLPCIDPNRDDLKTVAVSMATAWASDQRSLGVMD